MGKIFGENLKEMRKNAGIKQYRLAMAMNVTQQTVSSWEAGRTEPNMGQIEQLCKILGCNMSDLLRNTYAPITHKDRQLIDAFNKAPDSVKSAICTLLGIGGTNAEKNVKWYEDKLR